jgi:type IV pilus assembly protein PilM
MVEAELDGAVLLEADQVCPFSAEKSTVDYQLVPNGDESARGVLVAATNQLINAREQLVKSASLNCVLLDVEGLALLNCLEALGGEHKAEGAGHKTAAILNVGNSRTTLAIMGTDGLPFVREIASAGNDITERIAGEHNMDTQRVRQILSGPSQGESELNLADSLVEACEDLINDVNETLRFYTTRDKSTFVGKIYVCGGFALVEGFVGLLDSQLSARATLWNPLERCAYDAEQSLKDTLSKTGPSFAVAAGLAVRSI